MRNAGDMGGRAPMAGRPVRYARGQAGYGVIAWLVMALVALAIVAGSVLLVNMITSSTSTQEAEPTPTPSSIGQCPTDTWFDSATAACVPKAVCEEGQEYRERTNTCVFPPPALYSVFPATGLVTGNTEIRLTGAGFMPGASVTIDDVPAGDVVVVDATIITATTPGSKNVYPVDIEVQNPEGPPAVLDNAFTYIPEPIERATAVVPPTGSTQGGEAVVIKGTGFVDGVVVAFGGRAATDVTVLDRSNLRVITPFGQRGPVSVNIRLPGEDAFVLEGAFRYVDQPPRVVRSVRPTEGAEAGGTTITIVGTGFARGATVTVGAKRASKVKVVSSTRITAVTPTGALGKVTVGVRNPGVPSAFLEEAFEYVEAPTIAGVTPPEGSAAGGTQVTITGTGFARDAVVTIGGKKAKKVNIRSDGTITAVTPQGKAGPVTVSVKNPDQPIGTLKKAFTYTAAPTITAVSPAEGPTSGRTRVTITGTGFSSGSTVTFGGKRAGSVRVVSASRITAVTPKGNVGSVAVVVTDADGAAVTRRNAFSYVAESERAIGR